MADIFMTDTQRAVAERLFGRSPHCDDCDDTGRSEGEICDCPAGTRVARQASRERAHRVVPASERHPGDVG